MDFSNFSVSYQGPKEKKFWGGWCKGLDEMIWIVPYIEFLRANKHVKTTLLEAKYCNDYYAVQCCVICIKCCTCLAIVFPGLFQKERGTLFPFRLNISNANQLPLDTITDILIGVLRLLIIIFANFSDPTYKVIRMPTFASVQGQNYFLLPYYLVRTFKSSIQWYYYFQSIVFVD